MPRTVFTGFSPNITVRDTAKALGFLCTPWRWRKGGYSEKGARWLQHYFDTNTAVTFDSGRSALLAALTSLGITEGDEVLVQAYTCVVVANAIRFAGGKPVYVDVRHDLNMDPSSVERRITDRTKAIIIQHTFGEPADLDQLLVIAKKNHLRVIEDCAHSLGVRYKGRLTGTFGDIGMFSFGSDKVISCVRGGALVTNDPALAARMRTYHADLPETKRILIVQHLMHYPLFYAGRSLYHLVFGKWLLAAAKRLRMMNRIIYGPEKQGMQYKGYPSRLPNALAAILMNQFDDLERVQKHRKDIALSYDELLDPSIDRQKMSASGIPLRYTLFVSNKKTLHREAKKQGILLGDWYDTPVAPCDIDTTKIGYVSGDCPTAEALSSRSINLPTNRHIHRESVRRIVHIVNTLCT